MGTTVNDFIEKLTHYRDQNPANGQAEVMIAVDEEVAFEFMTASTVNAIKQIGMTRKDFIVFRGNQKGERIKYNRMILQ